MFVTVMAAPVKMDDSSSEDEETLAKLKEATVESSSFVNEPSCKSNVETKSKFEKKEQCSLRPDKQEATPVYSSVIETTPGTRKYIAKKLSAALDSEIDTSGSCFYPAGHGDPLETSGVKLFHHSTRYISMDIESVSRPKKRRPPSSSSDSSEDEKLAEAAVSHDFVMKQSSLPCYTDKKPPDVTIVTGSTACVKEVTSQISVSEPDKNNDSCKQTLDSDEGTDSVKHHKKKKKNKHKHRKSVEEG